MCKNLFSVHEDHPYDHGCAPAEISNQRFYDALAGPSWMVNATKFGHGDMLEPFYLNMLRTLGFCASNLEVGLEEDIYRSFTGGQIVAFLRGMNEHYTYGGIKVQLG